MARAAKNSRKQKRAIRRWRLDKFGDDVVREEYCEAGLGFSECLAFVYVEQVA